MRPMARVNVGGCLLGVGIAIAPGPLAAGDRPVVAVFSLQSSGVDLDAEARQRLSNYVGDRLVRSGRYALVPSSDVQRAIAAQKAESYRACYAESCQIEIGKELAASKSLATSIGRVGSRCLVTPSYVRPGLRDSRKSGACEGRLR